MNHSSTLLAAEQIAKTFPLPAGGEQTVLEQVTLSIAPGEVVALLGRSGSGKSTLLRIMAGLILPSSGRVLVKGIPLEGPTAGVAMVFQSFALLPWLTVQENAELGLYARGVAKDVCESEATAALSMVGLEGFEGAYPKELSGGMRQRVGFARAFVMRPDVLMMDEPFPMVPHTRVGGISGLLEIVNDRGGREDLPKLADSLRLEVDDLLPAVDASAMLGFVRLAVTSDVLPRFGLSGLYTGTLFRFKPRFFERLGPAVELGRPIVLPDYQKNYASLFLLWKGIMRFVQRRPEAPVLFGAVSISQEYRDASRGLIVSYLSVRASHDLARLVAPRTKFRDPVRWNPQIKQFAALAADIEDLSTSIADIEKDGKGVPVLIRQYLRVGGKLLGFNIDPYFSHALDALILADLQTTPPALLERCMGRAEAKAFLERQRPVPA